MKHFIQVTVGNHIIVHGFDDNDKEITESITVNETFTKLIAISRILSVSEKYMLT